ncbi:MAG: YihY/virulence factor BrkB family protein [Candidatus Dormibacteria bacterium]
MKAKVRTFFLGRAVLRFNEAKGQRWAVVVGWYGLLAFFPILLAVLTVLGLALHGSGIGETVRTSVVNLFPDEENRRMIQQALSSFQQHTGILAVVTLVSLLWSGSVLFGAMDQALDALYPTKPRSFIPQKLMAFGMILVFTVIAVPVVLSSSILPSLGNLPGVPSALTKGPVAFLLQLAFGVLGGALLFLAIYYVVPNRKQGLRDVLGGTLLAGVLFELFTLLFPLYFKLSNGFGKFGNTFGLFFLLMNFFYFIGLILMLGGSVNAERNPVAAAESPTLGGGMASPERAPTGPEAKGK